MSVHVVESYYNQLQLIQTLQNQCSWISTIELSNLLPFNSTSPKIKCWHTYVRACAVMHISVHLFSSINRRIWFSAWKTMRVETADLHKIPYTLLCYKFMTSDSWPFTIYFFLPTITVITELSQMLTLVLWLIVVWIQVICGI